jgi:hypothetical protein
VLQGGNEICRIEGFDCRKAVSELKVSIEAKAGLVPALTRLIHPESQVELQDHLTLEVAGVPSEQAMAAGVIQLYAQKLKKVVVASELQIAPSEVTDNELTVLCGSIRDDPPDILILCGCRRVTDISCLVQLSTISHLDISSCDLGAEGNFNLAGAIKDMVALSLLTFSGEPYVKDCQYVEDAVTITAAMTNADFSGKHLGSPGAAILAAWLSSDNRALSKFDISNCNLAAEGGKALAAGLKGNQVITELNISDNYLSLNSDNSADTSGIIAIADAIPDMRALTLLNLSSNGLEAEGAKIVGKAVKVILAC